LDDQLYGLRPLKLDLAATPYVVAYAGLFGDTNKINGENDIDWSDFAGGYALYAYNLTPDLAKSDHVNLSPQGTVRLNLKFGAALAFTVVAQAEFENMIEIATSYSTSANDEDKRYRSIGLQRRSVLSNLTRNLQRRYFTQ
jgi:hypothetical protein